MRSTFVNTLTELARNDPKIMLVIGDTGFSVFEKFEEEFGDRFINVGIAEQNFLGFSAGLAAMGMKPFAYNVVSFMVLRSMEQILLDVCYQENPVVLVGVGGGYAYGPAGPTHHALQDVAMLRTLPEMTIVCPCDPIEMRAATIEAASFNRPLYIRIGRSVDPICHENSIDFQFGKAIPIRKGSEVTILAYGTMVKEAIKVCDRLAQSGIQPSLYSMHTVKPLDDALLMACAKKGDAIFTMEEHGVIGGLGTAIAEFLAEGGYNQIPFHRYGVPDRFTPVTGSRNYQLLINGLAPEDVATDIKRRLQG